MSISKIEWTERSWNPVTGCTKISEGCRNCYAERMAKRLKAMGQVKYRNGFTVTCHEDVLDEPLKIKEPSIFFIPSMGDLFHEDVPFEFIADVFNVMQDSRHKFLLLTKRIERAARLSPHLLWTDNIWLGTSVEDNANLFRIDYLRATDAMHKFLSLEPLIGPLGGLTLDDIDWVIAGCESGPCPRPMDDNWIRSIISLCVTADVPFFLKQIMVDGKMVKMPEFDGKVWDQRPAALRSIKITIKA